MHRFSVCFPQPLAFLQQSETLRGKVRKVHFSSFLIVAGILIT